MGHKRNVPRKSGLSSRSPTQTNQKTISSTREYTAYWVPGEQKGIPEIEQEKKRFVKANTNRKGELSVDLSIFQIATVSSAWIVSTHVNKSHLRRKTCARKRK